MSRGTVRLPNSAKTHVIDGATCMHTFTLTRHKIDLHSLAVGPIYFYLQVRRFLGFSTAFRVSPSNIRTSDGARLNFASVYEFACVEVSPM
jgi:hypothetical protein